jgi:hypothetical protein
MSALSLEDGLVNPVLTDPVTAIRYRSLVRYQKTEERSHADPFEFYLCRCSCCRTVYRIRAIGRGADYEGVQR